MKGHHCRPCCCWCHAHHCIADTVDFFRKFGVENWGKLARCALVVQWQVADQNSFQRFWKSCSRECPLTGGYGHTSTCLPYEKYIASRVETTQNALVAVHTFHLGTFSVSTLRSLRSLCRAKAYYLWRNTRQAVSRRPCGALSFLCCGPRTSYFGGWNEAGRVVGARWPLSIPCTLQQFETVSHYPCGRLKLRYSL